MADPERFAEFREVSESLHFAKGVGLRGRVWATARLWWVIDAGADRNFPRAALLPNLGLKGAVGFPVLVSGEVLAVLEFFSAESRVPDHDLLGVLQALGQQLGFGEG